MAAVYIPVPSGEDLYVFIPACCYVGNQFEVLHTNTRLCSHWRTRRWICR